MSVDTRTPQTQTLCHIQSSIKMKQAIQMQMPDTWALAICWSSSTPQRHCLVRHFDKALSKECEEYPIEDLQQWSRSQPADERLPEAQPWIDIRFTYKGWKTRMNPRKTFRGVKEKKTLLVRDELELAHFKLFPRWFDVRLTQLFFRNCTLLLFPRSSFSSLPLCSLLHWSPSLLCNHGGKKTLHLIPALSCHCLCCIHSMIYTFTHCAFSPHFTLCHRFLLYIAHSACPPLSQLCLLLHFDHFFYTPSSLLSFRLVDFFLDVFISVSPP